LGSPVVLRGGLEGTGKVDVAESWRRRQLETLERRDAQNTQPFQHHIARVGLGRNLLLQNRPAETEDLYQAALDSMSQRDPESLWIGATQSPVGQTLIEQQKSAEAETALLKSYAAFESHPEGQTASVADLRNETVIRLVDLFTAWEKPDEAVRWQEKLALSVSDGAGGGG
jgi:hypothetical protein